MRILLMSVGTRGDCEPFLGVGMMLRARGEDAFCAFPEQYRGLAEASGFSFFSLGTSYIDLLEGGIGRFAMGGTSSAIKRFLAKREVAVRTRGLTDMLDLQCEAVEQVRPDCIIFHNQATYPLIWSLNTGGRAILLSTVPHFLHTVPGYPSVGFSRSLGILNPLTYRVANSWIASTFMPAAERYSKTPLSRQRLLGALTAAKNVYVVSPTLFPKPSSWPDNTMVAGFWERDQASGWQPPPALQDFIDAHEKILFITFGSMLNPDPVGKTATFLQVLAQCGIPAVINSSSGGLVEPAQYDRSLVHFTRSVPYDGILPHMYATIHHGGAGTTQSSLKAGCAMMAIPHVLDQPMWGALVHRAGAGLRGFRIGDFNEGRLKAAVRELFDNNAYRQRAQEIARLMKGEDFSEELYRFIVD
ncbi:MAG: glycosyltransferase [Coriobacteriales bacterium]|jgi:UDP:flavonoid glycosyltransferase YjiC (YdhE family)|nr:glycosyltransferase [Coriobacteriales bacterium]